MIREHGLSANPAPGRDGNARRNNDSDSACTAAMGRRKIMHPGLLGRAFLKSWGIRERIVFVAIMPATLIAVVLATYFLLSRYEDAERGLIERSNAMIRLLTPAVEYGVFSGNREDLNQLISGLAQAPDIKFVAVYDITGAVLAQVGTQGLALDPQRLADGWSMLGTDGTIQAFHAKIWRRSLPIDDPLMWPANTTPAPDSIGSITLEISRAGILASKQEMMGIALLVTLTTLALGMLLALRLSRDVSAPILSLQEVVQSIREGDLKARVVPHPAKTLRSLEDGINDMAVALQEGRDHLNNRIAKATAELQLKKDEAEQASVAKSRFLAAASHDLRQPLHALVLFSSELEYEANNPSLRRLAGQISSAIASLGELLDGLLDLSRIDLGATRPNLSAISLDTLLRRVVASYSASASAKALDLRIHRTSYWVLSDPILLYRMISNLVANAVRYTEHGGILVGARRVDDKIRIEIWDTGVGIQEEHQPLVFNEFYQAANPERDSRKGLGLGLSLVERLSRLLTHPISLRSRPGRGSMFGITVPRCTRAAQEADSAEAASPGCFDAHLLVVGKKWGGMWETLCKQLDSWGCRITFAGSLDATILSSEQLDLILCEGGNCLEILSLLDAAPATTPPALILIGEAPADVEAKLLGKRVKRLASPVQPAKLRALMQHLLDAEQRTFPDVHSAA
jgi:signal transduction histidine kinase